MFGMEIFSSSITGGHHYTNGTIYVGSWNRNGQRHGQGHLLTPDGIRYNGHFANGLYEGSGTMQYPDGSKYEGQFLNGWFHGYGVFWRADGMKHEGKYVAGKIHGFGLSTFNDGSNGFPRNEGYFQGCQLKIRQDCKEIIQKVAKISQVSKNVNL